MKEIGCARQVGLDDYVMQTLLVAIQASTRAMLSYKALLSNSTTANDAPE